MALPGPQKTSLLHAEAHRGYIRETSEGFGQTAFLFSIHDGKWIAWYTFHEQGGRFGESRLQDAIAGRQDQGSDISFGRRGQSMSFRPHQPRRVDEFVNPMTAEVRKAEAADHISGQAQAQITTLHIRGAYQITVAVRLNPAPERFNLVLGAMRAVTEPARHESGIVQLRKVEAFSGSPGPWSRFRGLLLR